MLLFVVVVVVVVGNKLMPTKALFYHWKHGSLGWTKSRVWFLPLSSPTVRYIAFCNNTSPARLGWPQICPGLKEKRGHMDTNPAQLGLKYFFCPTWPQIFFPGQSCPNRPQIWPRLKKKGAARLIETFSNNQTAANDWLGFTAGLASFDF